MVKVVVKTLRESPPSKAAHNTSTLEDPDAKRGPGRPKRDIFEAR